MAEQLVYTSEKALKDAGDKVPAEVKSDVEGKISALKSVKDTGTLDAIKSATEDLSQALQKVGQAMSQNQNNQQTPPPESPPTENPQG